MGLFDVYNSMDVRQQAKPAPAFKDVSLGTLSPQPSASQPQVTVPWVKVPQVTVPQVTVPQDPSIYTNYNPFPGNEGGERNMYQSIYDPYSRYGRIMNTGFDKATADLANDPNGLAYMRGMGSEFLSMMGLDDASQKNMLSQYDMLMNPQRQQQRQAMTDQAAAMGLGGGRLARNLSQMNSAFAQDTGTYGQALQAQNLTARQAIAQMLNANVQANKQNLLGQQQYFGNQIGSATKGIAEAAPTAKLAYRPVQE